METVWWNGVRNYQLSRRCFGSHTLHFSLKHSEHLDKSKILIEKKTWGTHACLMQISTVKEQYCCSLSSILFFLGSVVPQKCVVFSYYKIKTFLYQHTLAIYFWLLSNFSGTVRGIFWIKLGHQQLNAGTQGSLKASEKGSLMIFEVKGYKQ